MRWGLGVGMVGLLAACSQQPAASPPLVEAIEPAEANTEGSARIQIRGDFRPLVVSDLDNGQSEANADFTATLVPEAGGSSTPLEEVSLLDFSTIEALVPTGVPAGWYFARVEGPSGVESADSVRFKVFSDYDRDLLHDDEDPCVDVDGDGLGRLDFDRSACADPTADSDDQDPEVCADTDSDSCEDCLSGTWAPGSDGPDVDADGFCTPGDCDDSSETGALCGNSCTDFFADGDLDGFGDASTIVTSCAAPTGFVTTSGDCDDANGNCDSDCTDADGDLFCVNHDCDDAALTGGACQASCNTFFADADGDGFGNAADSVAGCSAPTGYVADSSDCADNPVADANCGGLSGSACNPGLAGSDLCDGADNDCDASLDEDHAATPTSCGVGACSGNAGVLACTGGVVGDTCDPLAGASSDTDCDNVDDNCDGTADDGYVSTGTSCGVGACAGNAGALTCTAGVESDSCDPLLGSSAENDATAGTCTDLIDNDCDGDTDLADLTCSAIGNTPPIADIAMSPAAGSTSTLFSADASGSFDLEDPQGSLTFEWDWEGDGTFEATGITSNHTFASVGIYTTALRVTDGGGLEGYQSFDVVVRDPGEHFVVTTSVDELNGGATPGSPGGTGFSLREAAALAQSQGGREVITFDSGLTQVDLDSTLALMGMTGYTIVGDGVTLNATAAHDPCIRIQGQGYSVRGLTIENCSVGILTAAGFGHEFSRLTFNNTTIGITASAPGGTSVGPNNRFNGATIGVEGQSSVTVVGNQFEDCQTGVTLGSSGSVHNNVFLRSTDAVEITGSSCNIVNNVMHATTGNGVRVLPAAANADVLNNIFSEGVGDAIFGSDSDIALLDHNNFFSGSGSLCTTCTPGANTRTDDPLYVDSVSEDMRLQPSSPLIDQGLDSGLDINGAEVGNFNGSAPDIGAFETPP